jgi:branched-chain amino acid transport system ATP-binding protein
MMLSVETVSVSFAGLQVLWDIDFKVNEGEIVALVGANAAGKTTTLKTIAGLVRPTRGRVAFDGKVLSRLPSHDIVAEGLCLIPEGRRLFPEMTVRENLELGAFGSKVWKDRAETLKRVYEIFPILREREKQIARTLSGGEQQMVAIGRGLMSRPRLCMLDEPSLGLSPIMVRELFRVVRGLRDNGTTVLLVEQNVLQTLAVADRAYVMENGRIVLEGPGQDLLTNSHVKVAYLGA